MNFKCPPRGAYIGCRLKRNIDKPRAPCLPTRLPRRMFWTRPSRVFFCFMARHALVCQDAWANTAIFRRTGEGNFLLRGTFWEERLIFTRLIFLLNQEDMGSQRRLMWLPAPNGTAAPNTGKKKTKLKKKTIRLSVSNGVRSISSFFPPLSPQRLPNTRKMFPCKVNNSAAASICRPISEIIC